MTDHDNDMSAEDYARFDAAEVAETCVLGSDGERVLLSINGKDYSLTAKQTIDVHTTLDAFLVWETVPSHPED